MEPIVLPKSSNLLKLPEQLYGTIKRVGILNKEPILYGDVNLLKPNDLYYINGAKQIYRYVKSSIEDDSMTYYFDTIKSIATDNLAIPEEERSKIRNAGYLFNEIIYSGDPNLVDNGQLFYHDTLPYISVISNVDGIINVSTRTVRIDGTTGTIVNEYRVSPESRDYSKDYLTFEALEDGTFTLNIPANVDSTYMTSVSYSIDNGETWTTTTVDNTAQTITTPTITSGSKVLWKGVGNALSAQYSRTQITGTNNFNVSGNIMSLLYGDNFTNQVVFPSGTTHNMNGLFASNTKLISAENLIMPATTVTKNCYNYMFGGCTALTTAPKILPATTLASYCYYFMFSGCTSLTTAPELPATTLVDQCYFGMFKDCIALTTAPELPATTLVTSCYRTMFSGCTSLCYIKAMFTTLNPNNTYEWVNGVASTGTFVKNSAAQWDVSGANGVPKGWTVETASADTNEITI